MAEEKYNLVFKGELVKGVEPAQAKANIGRLFKVDGAKLDALFSGRAIVLKRDLDFEVASKYRVAIKKAGARVDLMPAENREPKTPGKAVFGEQRAEQQAAQAAAPETIEYSASAARDPNPVPPSAEASLPLVEVGHDAPRASGELALAPVGAMVLEESERHAVEPVRVDTSNMALAEPDGDLLSANEKQPFVPRELDLSELSVAPVGAEVLKASERRAVPAADIDTSELDIAEPGARLSEPSPPPPPAPDVSGLHLEK